MSRINVADLHDPDDLRGIHTPDDLEQVREDLIAEGETLTRDDLDGSTLERFEEVEALLEAVNDRRDRLAKIQRLAANPRNTASGDTSGAPVTRQTPQTPVGEALDVLHRSQHASDELKEHAARLVEADETQGAARTIAAAADPHYAAAFGKIARDPMHGHRSFTTEELKAWQRAEQHARALDLSAGSAMVPTHLDPTIMLSSDGSVDPMRQVSRVVTITTTEWNGVSSAGVTTRWAAEGTEANDDSPALADPTVPTHKADSFVPVTLEAFGDMASVESELRRLFTDAKAQHEAPAFVTGTGTGQPQGVVSGLAAGQTVDTAAAGTFASEDVYALVEALPPRFRAAARWLAALPIINSIDQFETSNGAKLFPRVGDENPVLLRKPLHEHSELDEAITAGNHVLLVGAFQHYVIVDRTPAAVELIPHLFGENRRPTGHRGLYLWWRVGGAPVVANAFRRLEVAAA